MSHQSDMAALNSALVLLKNWSKQIEEGVAMPEVKYQFRGLSDEVRDAINGLGAECDGLREKVRSLESELAEQRSDAAMMAEVRDNLQAQLEDMSRARKRLEAENAALRQASVDLLSTHGELRNEVAELHGCRARAGAAEKALADHQSHTGELSLEYNQLQQQCDEWRNRAVAAEERIANVKMLEKVDNDAFGNKLGDALAFQRNANAKLLEQIDEWRSRAVALTKELEATRQGNRELLAERDQLRAQVTQLGGLAQQLREKYSQAGDDGDDSDDDEHDEANGAAINVDALANLCAAGIEVVFRSRSSAQEPE